MSWRKAAAAAMLVAASGTASLVSAQSWQTGACSINQRVDVSQATCLKMRTRTTTRNILGVEIPTKHYEAINTCAMFGQATAKFEIESQSDVKMTLRSDEWESHSRKFGGDASRSSCCKDGGVCVRANYISTQRCREAYRSSRMHTQRRCRNVDIGYLGTGADATKVDRIATNSCTILSGDCLNSNGTYTTINSFRGDAAAKAGTSNTMSEWGLTPERVRKMDYVNRILFHGRDIIPGYQIGQCGGNRYCGIDDCNRNWTQNPSVIASGCTTANNPSPPDLPPGMTGFRSTLHNHDGTDWPRCSIEAACKDNDGRWQAARMDNLHLSEARWRKLCWSPGERLFRISLQLAC